MVAGTAPALLMPMVSRAAVTVVGNVAPAPGGGGGNVAGPLFVGDTGYGEMKLALGTPVIVTSGSIFVGNSAAAIGSVEMTGFGSNLTTSATSDLVIGSAGTGSILATFQSRIVLGDDLLLGTLVDSAGSLFLENLGTVADVGDDVTVGNAGDGFVQIINGARLLADTTIVGLAATGDGRVTVSGNNSTWDQGGQMTIGEAGRGEVQIITGGRAESGGVVIGNVATGVGVAVVSGSSSSWNVIGSVMLGSSGHGTLNVTDGGQFTMTGNLRLSALAGSESHAIVSGAGSLMAVATTVTVGDLGFGTLDVRNGARLTSTSVVISDNSGSRGEVLVDGVGSSWRITGTLDVSDPGEAQLAITSGGLVSATGVVRIAAAGRLLMATGRLEAGSLGLTNNGLIQGSGRVTGNVTNTATGKIRLSPGSSMVLANNLTNSGLIDLDASELETLGPLVNHSDIDIRNSKLRAGGAGIDNNADAQIAITEGIVDVYGAVDNNAGAQIVVGGEATAVFHDTVTNSGQFFLFPGASVFALEDLTFTPTGALAMQLGSESESAQSAFEAAGEAALDGFLSVTLAPGYAPSAGDTFQVLIAAQGVTGTFGAPTLPDLASGLLWDLDYTPSAVVLAVVPGFSADFNGDGDVDADDLALWRTGYGTATGAMKSDGDADGDGDSDGDDFLAWQRQLGGSLPATPAAASVPEPASLTLGMGLLGLLASRFRRERRIS